MRRIDSIVLGCYKTTKDDFENNIKPFSHFSIDESGFYSLNSPIESLSILLVPNGRFSIYVIIDNDRPTEEQRRGLKKLIRHLMEIYKLEVSQIFGAWEIDSKICKSFNYRDKVLRELYNNN